MNITFRQFVPFMTPAETGSVSGRRAMHVTQPTAPMQLREIITGGLPCIMTWWRKIHLTEAGSAWPVRPAPSWTNGTIEQQINGAHAAPADGGGQHRQILRATAAGQFLRAAPRHRHFCWRYSTATAWCSACARTLDDLYVLSQPPTDMDLADHAILSNLLVLIALATTLFRPQTDCARALARRAFHSA